ncbi:MAG: DUF5686 and carboxypeptidase-like regulatory domain-containing protein [Rhodothermales bacterium]
MFMRYLVLAVWMWSLLMAMSSLSIVQAQTVVQGVVVDAETGETLPSAHVFIDEETTGTITNALGAFELMVPRLPATLRARFLGYTSTAIEVMPGEHTTVRIALQPSIAELGEVVVDGEDPAVGIMRQVIARKQARHAGGIAYQAEAYSRFMLQREDELVQVRETVAESFWRSGDGVRDLIRARRIQPRNSGTYRFATPLPALNFYADDIPLMGFTYFGPTHPNALDVYTFTLANVQLVDSTEVYEIYVAPKRLTQPAFVGTIHVLDGDYALLDVALTPASVQQLPPPVSDWHMRFEQQFAAFENDQWFPIDLRAEGRIGLARPGMRYPMAFYRQTTRLTGHVQGRPGPDSLFARPRQRTEMPFAEAQAYLFRGNPGMVPMTVEERLAVERLDPKLTMARAFAPYGMIGSLASAPLDQVNLLQYALIKAVRGLVVQDLLTEEPAEPRQKGWQEQILDRAWWWYNRVDGGHFGLKSAFAPSPNWSVRTGLGFTRARSRLNGFGAVRYTAGRPAQRLRPFLELDGGSQTAARVAGSAHSFTLTGVATYIGYDDYFDYYQRDHGAVTAGLQVAPLRTTLSAQLSTAHHTSLENNTDYPGWLFGDGQRPNPSIDDGTTQTAQVQAMFDATTSDRLDPLVRTVEVEAMFGIGGVGEGFRRVRAEAQWTVPTFFRRQPLQNRLRVKVVGGWSGGEVPTQRRFGLDGSVGAYSTFGTFRSLLGQRYEGEQTWGVFWEHDFSSTLFQALKLHGLVERRLSLAIHGAHGEARLPTTAITRRANPSSGVHHELGVGLKNLFGFPFRLDLTQRLHQSGTYVTVGFERRF